MESCELCPEKSVTYFLIPIKVRNPDLPSQLWDLFILCGLCQDCLDKNWKIKGAYESPTAMSWCLEVIASKNSDRAYAYRTLDWRELLNDKGEAIFTL